MRFLNFVRTESYVSLVEEEEIVEEECQAIPTYVFGVDSEGEYLRTQGSTAVEENIFVERRIETNNSSTILKIECAGQSNKSLFIITLNTTHHAFTLNNSCAVRSLSSFYYLQKTLKVGAIILTKVDHFGIKFKNVT